MIYVNEGVLKQFHSDVAAFIKGTEAASKARALAVGGGGDGCDHGGGCAYQLSDGVGGEVGDPHVAGAVDGQAMGRAYSNSGDGDAGVGGRSGRRVVAGGR